MKPIPTCQKLRGGYYTPKPVADFLARWAVRSHTTRVLEPSCGDGVFVKAALEALLKLGALPEAVPDLVRAVEIDPRDAEKTYKHFSALGLASPDSIHKEDFFGFCKRLFARNELFDAVIGNPPFIRYQNFLERHRVVAFELMKEAGLNPNRLTNSWVPFLVASTMLLNSHGRLAMVIPAELFQVNYAAETRQFLSALYKRMTIVTFEQLVFEGIQQEVVLLLGERDSHQAGGIRTIEMKDMDSLASLNHPDFAVSELKTIDHSTEKWTQYFLEKEEIELLRGLRKHPRISLSGEIIDVDVGVVTGQNDFFLLTRSRMQKYALAPHTRRIVARSGHLRGAAFSDSDWVENAARQSPATLLKAPDLPFQELPGSLKHYIQYGEKQGLHKGYKCRIRKRWYVVPSVWIPQAFMLRQVHGYPKLILNGADATCTDTIHRVNFRNGHHGKEVVSAFLNSLTFAFAEITGRSYGGGVLTFEPSESERLPIPLDGWGRLDFGEIDELLRRNAIEPILDITDRVLLREGLGMSEQETKTIRGIWRKLSRRRMNRRHT